MVIFTKFDKPYIKKYLVNFNINSHIGETYGQLKMTES